MSLQYVVKRGDSLRNLAGRHLGNFDRWRELCDYHNDQVGRFGSNRGRVFRIKDPNQIYVGQILYLPVRDKRMLTTAKATGAEHEACKTATPIDLKINYSFGYDDKPLLYIQNNRDHVIFTRLKGKIAIELMSTDRHVYNLELLTARDATQFRQKLNGIYNPPFCVLTARPEMAFNQNNVTLSYLTSVEGSKVTYTVNVSPDAPRKLKGSLKPKTIVGAFDLDGRRYKYAADLEFLDCFRSSRKCRGTNQNQLANRPARVIGALEVILLKML